MLNNVVEDPTFIKCIITGDETQIYELDVETKKHNSLNALNAIPAESYNKCMENWIQRWKACIGLKETDFEGDGKNLY